MKKFFYVFYHFVVFMNLYQWSYLKRTLTVFNVPEHKSEKIQDMFKNEYNMIITGGKAHPKGEIMRMDMGNCQEKGLLPRLSGKSAEIVTLSFFIYLFCCFPVLPSPFYPLILLLQSVWWNGRFPLRAVSHV